MKASGQGLKLVILRSLRAEVDPFDEKDYLDTLGTRYAERVIGNLTGGDEFCTACAPDCVSCRHPYRRPFGSDAVTVIDLPSVLPHILENPAELAPKALPPHDILLAVNIHEQILLEVLKRCGEWGTKGVVIPLEAPDWVSGATRATAYELCTTLGIEAAFPKPFCGFDPPKGGILDAFRNEFRIGRPDVELTVEDGKIVRAHVHVSAACGATYYVARWLVGRRLEENVEIEVISKRMHSYPCTASMERDPELHGDTPLHIAGQAHYAILSPHKSIEAYEGDMMMSPVGRVVQKPVPARENIEIIEAVKAAVMARLEQAPEISMQELRKLPDVNPAALSSALALLKKEGNVEIEGVKVRKR